MKTKIFAVFLILFTNAASYGQLRKMTNEAYARGEKLTYSVYYDAALTGRVKAGIATLSVKDDIKVIGGRNTYHIEALGKTKGAFNLFFKVVDRYETYIDEETLAPWLFIRRVDEGGYIINQDITFDQKNDKAYFRDNKKGTKSTIQSPEYLQDIISAIYYARVYNFDPSHPQFDVKFILDDTVYTTQVVYAGKATISTEIGTVRCIKIKPQVLTGNVFKDPYPMVVYVSDDKNRVPVLVESEILVGKVKMELVKYSGLKNAFSAMVK